MPLLPGAEALHVSVRLVADTLEMLSEPGVPGAVAGTVVVADAAALAIDVPVAFDDCTL